MRNSMNFFERNFLWSKDVFYSSWVKKNIKETYGGDEEVSDLCLVVFDTIKQ